jgi:hypothetical protein
MKLSPLETNSCVETDKENKATPLPINSKSAKVVNFDLHKNRDICDVWYRLVSLFHLIFTVKNNLVGGSFADVLSSEGDRPVI